MPSSDGGPRRSEDVEQERRVGPELLELVEGALRAAHDVDDDAPEVEEQPARTGVALASDREKAFERKFALDQELKFRAESRRNKALAEWAAGRLGLAGADLDEYVKAVRRADLAEKGDEDVFRKIRKDFDAKGVTVSDAELRKQMGDLLAQAVREIEATRS